MTTSRRLRRGGALVAVAGAGALVALGSAGAYVGGPGSGPLPHSNAPDLESAKIIRTVNPSDALGPQVRFCFDNVIGTVPAPTGFLVDDYNSNKLIVGTGSATPDPGDPKCTNITYANGSDVEVATSAVVNTDSVRDVGNTGNPLGAVPLEGSTLAPTAGTTVAPELVSVTPDAPNKQITYTFDEKLSPSTGGAPIQANPAYAPGNFGFYINTSNGNAPVTATGGSIINTTGKSVVVQFPPAVTNIPSAIQYVALPGAVQDVLQRDDFNNPIRTPSTIGTAGPQITGSPGLDGAVKNADLQTVDLHFTQGVNPGLAGGAFAYREDAEGASGGILTATSISTTNDSNNQTLRATFPPDAQKDAASLVRVAVDPTAATSRSGGNNVTYGAAAIGTCKCTPGYSDGPDLLSTVIHDDTNRADYFYDEAVDDTPPPVAANFRVLNPDGSETNGLDGVVLSADRKSVSVHFSGSLTATVGVHNQYAALTDETQQGNVTQKQTVGIGAPLNPQTGSTGTPGVTPTATATVQPTVTVAPTVTVTPGKTVTRKSTISIKRKKSGRKYTGKVGAKSPCKSGRTVRLYRGSKKLKTTKTKSSGSYSFSVKKQKKGKIKAKVAARTVKVGTTTYKCGAKTSKKV